MDASSQDRQDISKQVFSLQNILAKTTENLASSDASPKDLLMYVLRILRADAGAIFEYDIHEKTWKRGVNVFINELNEDPAVLIDEALGHIEELAEIPKSGIVQVQSVPGYHKFILVPIVYKGQLERYLCIISECFRNSDAIQLLLNAQMATGFFLYGSLIKEEAGDNWGFEQSTGLLEVIKNTSNGKDYSHACQALANELQKYMKCGIVSVAHQIAGKISIQAISETANFDKRGNRVRAIQRSLEEALQAKKTLEYPALQQDFNSSNALHDHQDLHLLLQAKKIISLPLQNKSDDLIGAISFIWNQDDAYEEDSLNVVQASAPYIETTFDLIKQARPSTFSRSLDFFQKNLKKHERLMLLGGLAAVVALMFVPFTYKINVPATLDPVLKRQIEAPFKSTLKQAFIEPGSIVRKGDLLAELEEKDVISQLSELKASRAQALKQAAAALAEKDPSEARISQLEAQKLDAKISILNKRKDDLLIKSPIDGMVVQGELKRLEGSPLQVGETLLEIAPLDEMYIQIALPEQDIRHVELGLPVLLKLDSFPGDEWASVIETIKPTATVRDSKNVFILEAKLRGFPQELRPGMKGKAKISTIDKPLYWILLHNAWDFLRTFFFW